METKNVMYSMTPRIMLYDTAFKKIYAGLQNVERLLPLLIMIRMMISPIMGPLAVLFFVTVTKSTPSSDSENEFSW